jgi:transposase
MPTCSTNAAVTGWPGKNCLMTSGRRSPAISGRSTVLLKTFDLDSAIAKDTVDDPTVQRLLTIAGVNAIVASGIIAAIGDISRFGEPQKLVSYFGLNPRVRQSGLGLAQHGRISKHGRSHATCSPGGGGLGGGKGARSVAGILSEDRQQARPPGRSGCNRPQADGADLAFADKGTGLPMAPPFCCCGQAASARLEGRRAVQEGNGPTRFGYNLKELRDHERQGAEQAEKAYQHLVRQWKPRGPKRTDATNEERR